MSKKSLSLLFGAALILALALGACSPGAVQEAVEQVAPTLEAAATQVAPTIQAAATEIAPTIEAVATEIAPTVEAAATEVSETMSEFEGISVAAENCDYGGKISSIEATDELTVQFNLCKPDPAFLAKVAFTPFGIQPKEWIEATGGTGELLERPIGTGPYMVDEWIRGDSVVFSRFEDYWGEPAPAATAVLRWNQEGAARLTELQAGTVDMITNVSPDDYAAVESDPNLQLLPSANPNIFYLGMTNNTFEPFGNVLVRQAIAQGIDRQRIVDNFYPEGSEVASHFTPCSIPGGCEGDAWWDYDPDAARALLTEAGYPDGFETKLYYRDVFRVYLPEPSLVAVDIQDQLAQLGITVEVVPMESGEFIDESTSGRLDGFYLLGWGADYPHPTNFLDFHFGVNNPQFGDPHPEIYEPLEQASQLADADEAAPLYAQANNAIRELVPMVPIAHGASADAALATLEGAYTPPFGATQFYKMDPGKDTLVYMQNAEPISLYCADETDGESLRPCQQVVETLLEYEDDSGNTVPELATACVGNEDATVWICTLREGVLFHDGSTLDANDVVFSWAVGIDAANPFHVGNTGSFDYFAYLWDGLINAPSE